MSNRKLSTLTATALVMAQVTPAFAQMQTMGTTEAAPVTEMRVPEKPRQPTPPPPQIGQGAGWNGNNNNNNNGVPIGQGAGSNGNSNRPSIGQGAGWGNGGNNNNNNNGNNNYNNGRPQIGQGAGSNYGNAGVTRCESWNYRYAECRIDTRGSVEIARVVGGNCRPDQNWGQRRGIVWVNNGCRADFRTSYGRDNGPSAGAVIGGAVIAAGLIALLSRNRNKSSPALTSPQGNGTPPARINVDTGGVFPEARPAFNVCLREAAREIGATGGTEIRLQKFGTVDRVGDGYRFGFILTGIYPDQARSMTMQCRATSANLIELTYD